MQSILGRLGMGLFVSLAFSTVGHAQFTYTTNADNTLTITDYSGGSASVSIPSNFNGRTVTCLGDDSFNGSYSMASVEIPASVTNIGNRTFYLCTNLTGVVIPNNVIQLGREAFSECSRLSSLTLGSGTKSIGDWSFHNCTNLLLVAVPDGMTNIGDSAFSGCASMTNLTIGTGLKNINQFVFKGCSALKSVSIPNNVTNIGNEAFSGCNSVRNVAIGSGVKSLETGAFFSCGALTNASIGGAVTTIGESSFGYCTNLANIVIPASVTTIGGMAFADCTYLKNVVIPDNVTTLGFQAFQRCTRLTNIVIGAGITVITNMVFESCSSLKNVTIPDGIRYIDQGAFSSCSSLTNVSIGTGVTNIGMYAFSLCGSLKNVSIPANVRGIGYGALSYCAGLTNIVVGDGVKSILGFAFQDCTSLKTAYIGSGVTSLGESAFTGCANLLGVYFSGNAPSPGANLYAGCNSATNYRMASATGWPTVPNAWAGRPTALWSTTTFSINPTSTNLSNAAASGRTIGVAASVSWTAASNVSWITITAGGSGTTNGTVTFSVTTNAGASSRTGGVVVAGAGLSQTCVVTQAGSPATLSINPTSTNLTSAAWNGRTIAVAGNVSWTATTNVSWITITGGASGTSNGPVTFNVATNSATSRTGGIVVAGGGISRTCTVVQAGVSAPVAPTNVVATKGSYTNMVRVTWTLSDGATGYEVWRFTNSNSSLASKIASGLSGSPYNDTNVTVAKVYYYWLKATNGAGASAFSLSDSGYASNSPPAVPTGVTASVNFSDRIRVSWAASTGATGYAIWRNTNNTSGSATNIAQGIVSPTYDDLSVPQGITHYYWVKATNASGASGFSASASGLRASTSFNISGTVTYGGTQTGMVQVMASPYFVGQPNIALTLDGVDDHVIVQAPTPVLQLTNTMTICAWVCVTGQFNGTYSTIMVKLKTSPSPLSYVMAINNSDGKPYVGFGDGANYNATVTLGQTNGWTHLAFTHDGTVGRWYINGQYNSATTSDPIHRYGDGPFSIGAYVPLETYFNKFPGQLDDVALWTNALTQGQIQSVMTNGMVGTEPGLVSCWNFDDGTANDLTTNANNGQFMSGATTANRSASGSPSGRTIASPGAYSITNILAGEYTVSAYRDSNGNGMAEPWEAYGTYPASPLAVTGNMANVNITLQDPVTDTDDDGLTDYDEIYLYGSSWTNADTDADGMPDGDEVLAGSSPTNNASMFGFADSQPVPESEGVVISWPSLSNRIYRLERSTNLLLGFEPYVNNIPADPPMNTYTDETPNVLGAYKVGVRME